MKPFHYQALALLLLAIGIALLFQTAPRHGEFWWSDAPRHAMDGVFYHDLIRDFPAGHIKQYAMDYYLRYPALTILFYPPFFPLVEAGFFGVFGVSHATAQLTVAVFYLLAAWGGYLLARRWFGPLQAFSISLLFIAFPEVALWGRQVMLEIPACALLLWSVYAFFRYLDGGRPRLLYISVLLLLAGLYTKQTVALIVPSYVLILWANERGRLWKSRHAWLAAGLLALGTIPLVVFTLRFGHVNVNSVVGGQWTSVPVSSAAGWLFYLREFPSQIGWPALVLAGIYLVGAIVLKKWRGPEFTFFSLWLVTGYLFFGSIALKEPRHTVLILFPLAVFAVGAIHNLLPAKFGPWIAVAFALVTLAQTLRTAIPLVSGYREAAEFIAKNAPPNSVVLFSGYRDGSFIFSMRSRADRPDLAVLRSDKLLLRVTQRRELGVQDLAYTESEISDMLDRYGVTYVVNQPNFWDDLASMQRLQKILNGTEFRKRADIAVSGNVGREDHRIEIFQRTKVIAPRTERIRLDLPIIDAVVEGSIGGTVGSK